MKKTCISEFDKFVNFKTYLGNQTKGFLSLYVREGILSWLFS